MSMSVLKNRKAAAPARSLTSIRRAADVLKQVSDPTRLMILAMLDGQEMNVGQICAQLNTSSQPAVSHHLALLRHGHLVEPRRDGKHNFYGLTRQGIELVALVKNLVGPF
jgi:DNA-binding transcriptional ArsR family regulator